MQTRAGGVAQVVELLHSNKVVKKKKKKSQFTIWFSFDNEYLAKIFQILM
jgi:hypothetical protein